MSSIMRARSALTGRSEGWGVIGGSSLELKVAEPSMLGIGCPDRHALPLTHSLPPPKMYRPRHPARAGSFSGHRPPLPSTQANGCSGWLPALGTRGFHRPLSDPSTDLQVRCHGSERDGRDVPLTDSCTAANHVIVLRQDPFIPFGLERQHRDYRECREGSPGSDAG